MPNAAYLVRTKKTVVALHDGKFHEYAVLPCDDRVSAYYDEQTRSVTVSVRSSEPLLKRQIEYVPEEDLRYLVIDLSEDSTSSQVIGVAEADWFDESAVGTIHFFV